MDNFSDMRTTHQKDLIILILTQLYRRQKLEYSFDDCGVLFLWTAGKDAALSQREDIPGVRVFRKSLLNSFLKFIVIWEEYTCSFRPHRKS
jgi:hypothetical protein